MASLYRRGSTYWAAYFLEGKRVCVSLDTQDEKKALRALTRLEDGLEKGEVQAPDDVMTLQQFVERYREHFINAGGPDMRASRERTWSSDKYSLRCVVEYFERQGLRRVDAVKLRHVEAFRDWRLTTEVSAETVNKSIRVGKAAWSWAVRSGFAKENPFKGVKLVKRPLYDPRFLSPFEVRKLLKSAYGSTLFALIATAVYAGLRLSELTALEWTDIVFPEDGNGHGTVRVRCTETFQAKSRKPRVIPLALELAAILRPMRSTAGLCFPSPTTGKRRNACDVAHQVVKYAKRAGLDDVTCHDLRRTFASLLAAQGVPTTRIRDYLGHASIATTEGYYLARGQLDHNDVAKLSFGFSPPEEDAGGVGARKVG